MNYSAGFFQFVCSIAARCNEMKFNLLNFNVLTIFFQEIPPYVTSLQTACPITSKYTVRVLYAFAFFVARLLSIHSGRQAGRRLHGDIIANI